MTRLFMPDADSNSIIIKRGEFVLRLTPAEVDKATKLLGIALGMETLDSLPDHITDAPFCIRFFEDNKLALERLDAEGSIPLEWAEADDLIVAIHDGKSMAINERTLIRSARGAGGRPQFSDEPFSR